MSKEFPTYEQAAQYAREQTAKLRIAHGLEKPTRYQGWTVSMIPMRQFRFGWELRCEAFEVACPTGKDPDF